MPSKSLALIWQTRRRSQKLDNNANVTKNVLKKKKVTKKKNNVKMMNRFQFRAPPPNQIKDQMLKKTGPSGLGSTTINKPKPKPPPSEDLWGDLDDDFLVQASQVAEKIQQAANAKAAAAVVTEEERMEMDDDVLTMFIQEEEKFENLPPPIKPQPPQPVRLRPDPIKPKPVVESRPENQVIKSQASSSKPPENVEKSLGEIEKIKEESQSWKQKYQAKSGENSFLRRELGKLRTEVEDGRRERIRLGEQKSKETKALQDDTKMKLEGLKSEKQFIQRELDEVTEQLQKLQKLQLNIDGGASRSSGCSGQLRSLELNSQPPLKKAKISNIPSNIDESLYMDAPKKKPLKSPKNYTKEIDVQTDLELIVKQENEEEFEISDELEPLLPHYLFDHGPQDILKSLHQPLFLQLKNMTELVDSLYKHPDNDYVRRTLHNLIVFVDQMPESDIKMETYAVSKLIDKLFVIATRDYVAVDLTKAILRLQLIDVKDIMPKIMLSFGEAKDALPSDHAISHYASLIDLMSFHNFHLMGSCQCKNEEDGFIFHSVWTFLNQWGIHLEEEEVLPFSDMMVEKNLICLATTFSSGKYVNCQVCRRSVSKSLVTVLWSALLELLKDEENEVKIGLVIKLWTYFQAFWRQIVDLHSKEVFMEMIGQDPHVQRRYLYCVQHLQKLYAEGIFKVQDTCILDENFGELLDCDA